MELTDILTIKCPTECLHIKLNEQSCCSYMVGKARPSVIAIAEVNTLDYQNNIIQPWLFVCAQIVP